MSYTYIYGEYRTNEKLITAERYGVYSDAPRFELKTVTVNRYKTKAELIKAFNNRVPTRARIAIEEQ